MNITDTGIRGYLRWLQQDQPGLYQMAAPIIAARVPAAFSDFEQSRALGYLSDTTGGAVPGDTTYFGDTPAFDPTASASSSVSQPPDVASVANVGAASPSVGQQIASIISSVANAVQGHQLTTAQVNTLNAYNQQQLAHAVAGNYPMQVSTTASGIPLITAVQNTLSSGSGTLYIFAAAAVIGVLLFGGARKAG